MEVAWFLPAHYDGRRIGTEKEARAPTLGYLADVARVADRFGFSSILLPTGYNYEDAWVIASTLVPFTERLRFIVALRPGLMTATVAARMSSTFDRLSAGRLMVNIVVGGDPDEIRADGQLRSHDARYQQADEWIEAWKRLMAGDQVTVDGEWVKHDGARLRYVGVQQPHPEILMGGSSPTGIAFAADHVDTYLTWGEPPAAVADKLATVRAAAKSRGRKLRMGIRLHTVIRDTDDEAWQAADDLIRDVDDTMIAERAAILRGAESEGQRRMLALSGGSKANLEVSPNLWAGVGLVRGGAGTALVGSPETVAERILEYQELGVDLFILSGFPHLEEAYRVGEQLLPRLPVAQRQESDRPLPVGGQVASLATDRRADASHEI